VVWKKIKSGKPSWQWDDRRELSQAQETGLNWLCLDYNYGCFTWL